MPEISRRLRNLNGAYAHIRPTEIPKVKVTPTEGKQKHSFSGRTIEDPVFRSLDECWGRRSVGEFKRNMIRVVY
jgi:hypothetical protein